jgi:hypothetical protein
MRYRFPYAERVRYAGNGRHHASARRAPLKRLVSLLRDLGDLCVGDFFMASA